MDLAVIAASAAPRSPLQSGLAEMSQACQVRISDSMSLAASP